MRVLMSILTVLSFASSWAQEITVNDLEPRRDVGRSLKASLDQTDAELNRGQRSFSFGRAMVEVTTNQNNRSRGFDFGMSDDDIEKGYLYDSAVALFNAFGGDPGNKPWETTHIATVSLSIGDGREDGSLNLNRGWKDFGVSAGRNMQYVRLSISIRRCGAPRPEWVYRTMAVVPKIDKFSASGGTGFDFGTSRSGSGFDFDYRSSDSRESLEERAVDVAFKRMRKIFAYFNAS